MSNSAAMPRPEGSIIKFSKDYTSYRGDVSIPKGIQGVVERYNVHTRSYTIKFEGGALLDISSEHIELI